MTSPTAALGAARRARGWSQSEAARALVELGRARGAALASASSLKTLLSRWENGHAVPDPQRRALLAELYGRTAAELGIAGSGGSEAAAGIVRLRGALAAAVAVDPAVLDLWREQLAAARRLDDELGAAGAGGLVRAQVDQLDRTLAHTVGSRRAGVAAVLAEAAVLAATQARDLGDHEDAWLRCDRAVSAATEAGRPVTLAAALAGKAGVLVDIGEPAAAVALLEQAAAPHGASAVAVLEQARSPLAAAAAHLASARLAAARGLARAAAGQPQGARMEFTTAEQALRATVTDAVHPPPGLAVELSDLHRRHGRALVTLGDPAAVGPLELALAAQPRSARHRAGLHADLATALTAAHQPERAAEHASRGRALAERIGSARIAARLARG